MSDEAGPAVQLHHRGGGELVTAELTCAAGHAPSVHAMPKPFRARRPRDCVKLGASSYVFNVNGSEGGGCP